MWQSAAAFHTRISLHSVDIVREIETENNEGREKHRNKKGQLRAARGKSKFRIENIRMARMAGILHLPEHPQLHAVGRETERGTEKKGAGFGCRFLGQRDQGCGCLLAEPICGSA